MDWNTLSKQDKATLLKSAGLPIGLSQLSWSGLQKSERAKLEKAMKSKGKGWHEEKKEVRTEKGIEKKAPIHRQVAIKKEASEANNTPMQKSAHEEKVKEPWQMTQEEYLKASAVLLGGEVAELVDKTSPSGHRTKAFEVSGDLWRSREATEHKYLVKTAISEGKPVPERVIADYPDLKISTAEIKQKDIEKAEKLGGEAFRKGMENVPARDKDFLEILANKQPGEGIPYLEAWAKGWHKERAQSGTELIKEFQLKIEQATAIPQLNELNKEVQAADESYRFVNVPDNRAEVGKLYAHIETKIKSLKVDKTVYEDLKKRLQEAKTVKEVGDINQAATLAELKGTITFEQLQEVYSLIHEKDEAISRTNEKVADFIIYQIEEAMDRESLNALAEDIEKSSISNVYKTDLRILQKKKLEEVIKEAERIAKRIDEIGTTEGFNAIRQEINTSPLGKIEKDRLLVILNTKEAKFVPKQTIYDELLKQIRMAKDSQKLDDLHQDANRAEVKGQITATQLEELYKQINYYDEMIRKNEKERLSKLQSEYHTGDFLERRPDVDTVIKPGIYTIMQVMPKKIISYGIAGQETTTVNEYRIAGVRQDGSLNPVQAAVLTASMIDNYFTKTTPNRQVELNKLNIEQTKAILIEGINRITTVQGLDEFDVRLKEHLIANSITSVEDPRISDVIVAINKRRRELTGSMSKPETKIIRTPEKYEIDNLKYEAEHVPSAMLPPKVIEDVTKYSWGLSETEAVKKYVDKERKKLQSNIDYTNKQKAELDATAKDKPWVLLTRAEIQKRYPPEEAEQKSRDLWTYKTKKSDYEKNADSARFWQSKVDKIDSGEWQKINTNYLREQYQKEVKEAIKHGKPVPFDVIKQYPEFTKAQDNRERYDKGRHTSFANVSIAVDTKHQENTGVKIKRQDGKALDEKTADEVVRTLSQLQSVIGDITPIMKRENLTVSHTGKKHPFLSTASGIYHGNDVTISLGKWTGAHETAGHFLDETAKRRHKDQPFYDYNLIAFAKKNMNGGIYAIQRAMALNKSKSPEELEDARNLRYMLGSYWQRVEEINARLVEQYIAYKNKGISGTDLLNHPYELYIRTPAYWDDVTFTGMLPQIETELQRKIKLARE